MKRIQQALALFVSLTFTHQLCANTLSVTSDGSDGAFTPAISTTLTDLQYDFTSVDISSGITVDFTQDGELVEINFLATTDIIIDGILDAGIATLRITTPGTIYIGGSLTAGLLHLEAGTVNLSGNVGTGGEGSEGGTGENSGTISINGSNIDSGELVTTGGTLLITGGSTTTDPIITPVVGTITIIPVPAAIWLFASGLLVLAGAARRTS